MVATFLSVRDGEIGKLNKNFHRCFTSKISPFGRAVSEEKSLGTTDAKLLQKRIACGKLQNQEKPEGSHKLEKTLEKLKKKTRQ